MKISILNIGDSGVVFEPTQFFKAFIRAIGGWL